MKNFINPTIGEMNRYYSEALDSISNIKKKKPESISDIEWCDFIDNNKKYLIFLLSMDFWTDQYDLTPLRDAISKI